MTALDQSTVLAKPRPSLPLLLAGIALAVGFAGLAARGFDQNGARIGAQWIWRFGGLVFFCALVASPAARFIPALRSVAASGHVLLQGFCAVLGVFFGFLLMTNLFVLPDGVTVHGITAGMTFFVVFTGLVTLVLALAVSRRLCDSVGEKACRAMLGVGVIYFWLCHVLIAMARLSGQGDESLFHPVIVFLLLTALIARFAGRFSATSRAAA